MGDLASCPYLLSNLKVQTWQYLQPNTLAKEGCPMEDCSFTPIPGVVPAPQIPTGQHLLPNLKVPLPVKAVCLGIVASPLALP